jgi:hypothetical protein
MPPKLTAQQAIDVAGDCIRQVTHSHRPLNLAEALVLYGIFTPQQAAAVRNNVVANGVIGVPRFNFSLNPTFLINLGSSSTLGQLVAVIRQNSVPNQPGLLLDAPESTGSENLALAAMHLAEAAAHFSKSTTKRKSRGKSKAGKGKKAAKKSSAAKTSRKKRSGKEK